MKLSSITRIACLLLAAVSIAQAQNDRRPLNTQELPVAQGPNASTTQYLAFQIFTGTRVSPEILRNLGPGTDNAQTVDRIIRAIGTVGSKNRKLGFVPGPLAFDHADDEIRKLMRNSFVIARENNIAVGFHIDDSMFWRRLSYLNTTDNIEWLDWDKTPNTGRLLNWSVTPTRLMPQLCMNSPAVLVEVKKRSALIGEEARRGMESLRAADKDHLFIGVIAGWETRLGKDFATGKYSGYNALTRKGFSAKNTRAELDEARVDIVKEFIDFWTKSLAEAGIPDGKIFSHAALPQLGAGREAYDAGVTVADYLEKIDFSPPRVAFGPHYVPGLSTYPPFHLDEIKADRVKYGMTKPWASCEGSAVDPASAAIGGGGIPMEAYLANLFNKGAILVDYYGWEVGPATSPFRKSAEGEPSLKAYRKFLRGEELKAGSMEGEMSPFQVKMQKLGKEMPIYIQKNGPEKAQAIMAGIQEIKELMKARKIKEAEQIADRLLNIIGK
ncbi:MAG: hypothetical protein HY735_07490 [Verrucomicrobia bacterium]|nr:hypothetical protein [Verrucomicrobiota bacterium]